MALSTDIKERVTLEEAFTMLGGELPLRKQAAGYKVFCPAHEERDPSLFLYDDGHFHCFSCGAHGSGPIDMVMHAEGIGFTDAVFWLRDRLPNMNMRPTHNRLRQRYVPKVVDFTDQFEKSIGYITASHDTVARGWWPTFHPGDLWSRGWAFPSVSPATWLIPHRHDGEVPGVKVRDAFGKTSWPGSTFTVGLYRAEVPYSELAEEILRTKDAVLVEGESDCWTMIKLSENAGWVCDVWALPSGAASVSEKLIAPLRVYDTVFLAMDNDPAGDAAYFKVVSMLEKHVQVRNLRPPSDINDCLEAAAHGWTLRGPDADGPGHWVCP